MAIDVERAGSPGWWIWQMSEEQRRRRKMLDSLWARFEGKPPLPEGARAAREAFEAFQRLARSNLAELAVRAVAERSTLLGFRTSDEQVRSETTDPLAGQIWSASQMEMQANDVHQYMGAMGCGYTIVGPPGDEDLDGDIDPDDDFDDDLFVPGAELDADLNLPIITVEDPREVITAEDDDRPGRPFAAMKYKYDPQDEVDRIFVYLRGGQIYVARRDGRRSTSQFGKNFRFSPKGWSWENLDDPHLLPTRDVPVTRYRCPRENGEFERHTDLLDRINHQILQRMTIATMQAFRQRAVKGLPEKDDDGHVIDYSQIFDADPAAIWQLPAAADMWESGQVDLTPILSAVKDDMREFMANTSTPMSYLFPDAAGGSAEGASLTREGLTFKVEDTHLYAGVGHVRTMRLALAYSDQPQLARRVTPLWAPAERFSLAQRYDAAQKSVTIGVPWRTRMLSILQFTPAEVTRMEVERIQDQLLEPASAGGSGGGPGGEGGDDPPDDPIGGINL